MIIVFFSNILSGCVFCDRGGLDCGDQICEEAPLWPLDRRQFSNNLA